MLAPRSALAADPRLTRGRLRPEPDSPTRTAFQRDRDRIVHSQAFRRLAHKTQVFVHHEGDHFRTRLTHTIEVAQLARTLARAFALDEDLAEAVALGHDLGHTPFGHAGEDALDACMAAHGGFDHNSHGLRIVTELERRYAEFDGLNLTWETLEGLVKHNGPLLDADGQPAARWRARGLPETILAYDRRHDLRLKDYPALEAQAAALADDIAYNAHDIDDGLRAGLFGLDELAEVPFLGGLIGEVEGCIRGWSGRAPSTSCRGASSPASSRTRSRRPRRGWRGRASRPRPTRGGRSGRCSRSPRRWRRRSARSRRSCSPACIAIPRSTTCAPRPTGSCATSSPPMSSARRRRRRSGRRGARRSAPERATADYVAGMTDRFALDEHRRLFDPAPRLR